MALSQTKTPTKNEKKMTALKKAIAKIDVLSAGNYTETTQISNDMLPSDAKKELAIVARSLGAEFNELVPVFTYVVTKKGAKFLSTPEILSDGKRPVINWGGKTSVLKLDKMVDDKAVTHIVSVSENGAFWTLDVAIDDEEAMTLRIRVKPDVKVSRGKMMSAFMSGKLDGINEYLHSFVETENLDAAPERFTVDSLTEIKAGDGRKFPILHAMGRQFWAPNGADGIKFPAEAIMNRASGTITIGGKELSLGGFGKLKDLEVGTYSVTAWERTASDQYGEGMKIRIDGRWYNANAAIKKALQVLEPILSESNPGTLTIDGKQILASGNTKVICRFVPPASDDEMEKAFARQVENSHRAETAGMPDW
jgi:hypothetical protein